MQKKVSQVITKRDLAKDKEIKVIKAKSKLEVVKHDDIKINEL